MRPPVWSEELLRPFGQTPWGENIWRVVWAPDRITCYGGYWGDKGLFEYRIVRRYPHKCWMLERWLPARHFGTPQTWAAETCNGEGYLSTGPYPKFGLYLCGYLFAAPDHSYIPLFPDQVLLTARAVWCGRVNKTWEIRDAVLSQEEAKQRLIDKEFENKWDATHGVRRGSSFSTDGAIQNSNAEIEEYKQRLAASGVQLKREEFQEGFRQL